MPFGLLMLLGFLLVPLPPRPTATPGLLLAGSVMAAITALVVLAPWKHLPRSAACAPPLACLFVVALLRHAEGGATTGLSPLALVPMFWFALYGTRAELLVSISAVAATFVAPILIFGAPRYPATQWEAALVWTAGALLMGPVIQALVSTTRSQAEELEHLAHTDSLTGLPNLRAWEQSLDRELRAALRSGESLSLVMIDLDNLKTVNDSEGHEAGSRAITESAAAWASQLRPRDIIARFGGDEFSVLLPDADGGEALEIAERLRTATPGHRTCSIGVACWDGSESIDDLFRRADTALYEAKRAGRDRTVLDGEGVRRLSVA